jgi:coenzyme F420 biosynthesis associated uncharacterized protein
VRQVVDWDLAVASAGVISRSGPHVTREEATAAVVELRRLAVEAQEHVSGYARLAAPVDAPARVVDRREWVRANVEGFRGLLVPLMGRLPQRPPRMAPSLLRGVAATVGPYARSAAAKTAGLQVGAVLGYVSGKVLGQYEVFSADPGQLLLVAPNIVEAERALRADPHDFRLWVCLHEATHRAQFTAVPWMRSHFLSEVEALFSTVELDTEVLTERIQRAAQIATDIVRDPDSTASLMELIHTPEQRAVLDRLTALMTLLEGHAEFVMDGVGPEVVPSVEAIRGAFNARRASAGLLERLVRRVLGVEAKLRQYAQGRAFVAAAVEAVGIAGFNQVWAAPDRLPTLQELADPAAWVARVAPQPS